MQLKKKIVKGLLNNNFTITDKRYVEYENDTGFHHYNIDVAKYYEMEEDAKMDKDNVRTVAFQVPTELFEQLKAYLKRNGIKQNAFFLDCIRQALAEDTGAAEE